ncbi:MAG: DUF305 domain-containing protein [Pseudonocardiales bacterium]|nr:MAG: DUF305 domain-containing protein [Pseudonocardiales bacterium]
MRPIALCAAAAAAVFGLVGCGEASSPTTHTTHTTNGAGLSSGMSAAAGVHDAADVTFAQQMILHHAQAVAMARLAPTRADSPAVKALAVRIEAAQDPEIVTMTGWLKSWGAKVPDTSHMGGVGSPMGMGRPMGAGMMSRADMSMMAGMSGRGFDRMCLTMMTRHHQGAIAMAHTEQAAGTNPAATKVAAGIISSQSAGITTMAGMLKTL